MSEIEDSRKVLQDFLAPELRAIAVRLDALEKRFDALEGRMEKQFAAVEGRMDKQFVAVDKCFDDVQKQFADFERLADKCHEEVLSAFRQVIAFNTIQQRLYGSNLWLESKARI